MATKEKQKTGKPAKSNEEKEQKPKSKIILAREKYPEGIGHIVNMRAVLK